MSEQDVPFVFSVGCPNGVPPSYWEQNNVRICHESQDYDEHIPRIHTGQVYDLLDCDVREVDEVRYQVEDCSSALDVIDTLTDAGLALVFPDDLGIRQQLCQFVYHQFRQRLVDREVVLQDILFCEEVNQRMASESQSLSTNYIDIYVDVKVDYTSDICINGGWHQDRLYIDKLLDKCKSKFDIRDEVTLHGDILLA